MFRKFIPCISVGVVLCAAGICSATGERSGPDPAVVASEPARQVTTEVSACLQQLQKQKLLLLQLNDNNGFFRSQQKLLEKIETLLPDYYRLTRGSAADPASRSLVPLQPRLFFTYGDYTGNVALPVISCGTLLQPVILKTNIINNLLPAFQSEDTTVKLFFADGRMRITNRRDTLVQLLNLSLDYNGRIFDNILTRPVTLPPSAMFEDQTFFARVDRDLDLRARHQSLSAEETQREKVIFGFGLHYLEPLTNKSSMLSLVNSYSVDQQEQAASESARLDEHLQAVQQRESQRQFAVKAEFATGEAAVKEEHLPILNHLGTAMQQEPMLQAIIDGHTDDVGGDQDNMLLSRLRAESIKQFLVQKFQIAPERMITTGYGMSRPVASNDTPAGRAQNRRIEVRVEVRRAVDRKDR